ncbi:MAG: NAD-dependent epimerase/dehydratase family protein [Elusimicrobiaceae bacterium]|nr:NAD-dependent epimerase/dehydratase family protein [Elusimicrobiaceae bacterium]
MDFKQRNHWLVTGGAGFIGSHLVRTLAAQNQQVTVLDNLSNGNMQNLLSVQDKIHFINGDICDFKTCISASAGVDYVLHHAALVSVAQSMENPRQTLQTNVQGTQNILEASVQNHIKRFIFASSAAVYGTRPELPYTEQTPVDCKSPYAWSKQAAAELCRLYTKSYGLETVVLRYFNVYGPGQNPNAAYAAVVAKFMQLADENKTLGIDWDGLQRRDFINVQDVVQAVLLAVAKGVSGETYNVASGRTYTLLELADTIEKIFGRPLKRVQQPKRPGDVHESSADIGKIRALGFIPRITLEQGLAEMKKVAGPLAIN